MLSQLFNSKISAVIFALTAGVGVILALSAHYYPHLFWGVAVFYGLVAIISALPKNQN